MVGKNQEASRTNRLRFAPVGSDFRAYTGVEAELLPIASATLTIVPQECRIHSNRNTQLSGTSQGAWASEAESPIRSLRKVMVKARMALERVSSCLSDSMAYSLALSMAYSSLKPMAIRCLYVASASRCTRVGKERLPLRSVSAR